MTHQPFSLNNPFGNTSRYRSSTFDVSTLEAHLEAIRLLSSEEVQDLALRVLPLDRLPLEYLYQLGDDDWTTAYYRASCLAWGVTGGILVPRELQLRSCLATHDSLICAGTGSGKTLPILMIALLSEPCFDAFQY